MPDTMRTLMGGPLDGKQIELTDAEHEGISGVLLPHTDGHDDRVHNYEPGENPRDGRLYYRGAIG